MVSVVVLNWNGWPLTARCIASILDSDGPPPALVVVDNASSDDSWQRCLQWFESAAGEAGGGELAAPPEVEQLRTAGRYTACRTRSNLGYAGGCNVGARLALAHGASHVVLLNNDTLLERAALGELLAVAGEARAAIVGARIVERSGADEFRGAHWPAWLLGLGQPAIAPEPRHWPSALASGAAMLISAEAIAARVARTGYLFDPAYFMYCEETDFCLDAGRGLHCVIAGRARAQHEHAASSGGPRNPRSYYYLTRNRMFLARAHLGALARCLYYTCYVTSRLLVIARNFAAGRRRAARAVWEGLRDGLRAGTGKWSRHDAP